MTEDLSAETLARAADKYGISVTDEERSEHLETARTLAATADTFDVEPPTSDEPNETRDGDDPHNAFRTRFELSPTAEGALEGLEIAVKENVAVAGVETTCGSPGFTYTPPYSATAVERLRDAGAAIVGTTNMDEFAFFTTGETCAHGRTENPVVDGCVPGGSSSGSGAAVAAGLVDCALGTDTGGSIRIPASFCGVVGVKPTHRLVSRFGVVDLSLSLDHVGPLAPDVETAAEVTAAVAGPDVADPSTHATPHVAASDLTADLEAGVDGLALGVVEESMAAADDAVERAMEETLADLESAGATVTRRSLEGYDLVGPAVGTISGAEFASFVANAGVSYGVGTGTTAPLRDALAEATEGSEFGANVQEQLLYHGALNEHLEGRQYVAAMDFGRRFTATVREHLSEVDALVTPTTPMAAPPFGSVEGMDGLLRTIANTAPFNLTGTPAVSVPCGETAETNADEPKPVGLQVVTDWHDEATALQIARAVEERT
ncbi:Asp-tRNA(Asn)/Glu-tRNA(Gln) amidotransferase GatCAB subunit A [Natronococcus pandeyae]|uniref:Asp-tRNA(Asn)/Glu-tRNA(Gln) amidotransferase GatCAB subunit A n=1 Tax=Natronococcus pandeyae TaxID=2055836 RepID=A0A8J8Q327_9EURY|nr:amidase [Natronococcus pandeyae]TYL37648.1 Asp-tRNA(Asn)/Glu-tRNA(Gln) amidotransferase GatCAB subunit A [Natronococcus pandeyae]